MARIRRMLAPINSVKHFVTKTNAELASGAVAGLTLVDAVAKSTVRTATNQVDEGSVIKAIHLEYWLNGQGTELTGTSQFVVIVEKLPAGGTAADATDMANLQSYENKKNILYTTQGVIAGQGAQSIPVLRDWIKIPKGKQRFGLDDKFVVSFFASGFAMDICGIAIYKEYY